MVSKASELFPDPETPTNATASFGDADAHVFEVVLAGVDDLDVVHHIMGH
jgi:hypothetical protein